MRKRIVTIMMIGLVLSGCVGEKTMRNYNNSIDTARTLQEDVEKRTLELEVAEDEVVPAP